jgi:hypothetical protein
VSTDNHDLDERVFQFRLMELPGQPMMMHMGTNRLVNDLHAELKRERARVADLEANNPKLWAADSITHKKCGGLMYGPLITGNIVVCSRCGADAEVLVDDGGTDLVFRSDIEKQGGGDEH